MRIDVTIELDTSVKDLKSDSALRESSKKGRLSTTNNSVFLRDINFCSMSISRNVDIKNDSDKIQREVMNILLNYTGKNPSLIVKQGRMLISCTPVLGGCGMYSFRSKTEYFYTISKL